MATVSLCMISLNEEGCIEAGIKNCYAYVDEIIIIDAFSIDRTKEIATAFDKVKWFEHPWEHHFANQKNRCLEKASCEWILFKDCDEMYEQDALDNLQRLTVYEPYRQCDAFAFARKTYVDGTLVNLSEHDYQVRFWQHGKDIHYEGHLHEGVTGYDSLMLLNVWIIHTKTTAMQQADNEQYWDMGQTPPPGWIKKEGRWVYEP